MSWFIVCPECGVYLEDDFSCPICKVRYEAIVHPTNHSTIIVNVQSDDTTVVRARDGD